MSGGFATEDILLLPLLGSGATTDFLLPTEHGENVYISDQTAGLHHMIRTNVTLLSHLQEKRSLEHSLFNLCRDP